MVVPPARCTGLPALWGLVEYKCLHPPALLVGGIFQDFLVAYCSSCLEWIRFLAQCAPKRLRDIRLLKWIVKLNFSFPFFSPSQKWVHEYGVEKQMNRVYKKKLHLDNLGKFCVDVCTFTYYYSYLAVNMKINFYFLTLSILFKKMNALTNYTFPLALL